MARTRALGALLGACLMLPLMLPRTAAGAAPGEPTERTRRAPPRADLKMDRTSFIPEPGRLSLKYELHNAGPDGTRGVVLEATLTGNLQSVSQLTTPGTRCSHRLRRGGATVRCELPAIPSGGGVTLFVQAQVKSRGSLDLKERVEVRSVDAVDPLPDDNVLEAQSRFVRQRPSNVARRHGAPRPPPPGQVEPGSPRR